MVYKLGLCSIGENRVKEAIEKFQSLEKVPNIKKRFIGHLQSNKVKKCVGAFDTIDSIHSLKTLKKVSRTNLPKLKTIKKKRTKTRNKILGFYTKSKLITN